MTTGPQIIFIGDSLANGYPTSHTPDSYVTLPTWRGQTINKTNIAVNGQTLTTIIANAATNIYPLYANNSALNILMLEGGVNDGGIPLTAQQRYDILVPFCGTLRNIGWKIICVTFTDNTDPSFGPVKNQYNDLLRNNWRIFADGLADVGADIHIGLDGCASNLTYFQSDGGHLTDAGYTIYGGIYQTAINTLVASLQMPKVVQFYESDAWVPLDTSGAALSFSFVNGRYTKIADRMQADACLVYPTTTNTSAAKISGFPYDAANGSYAQQGSLSYHSLPSGATCYCAMNPNTKTASFYDTAGNPLTNAQMSGASLRISMSYHTDT